MRVLRGLAWWAGYVSIRLRPARIWLGFQVWVAGVRLRWTVRSLLRGGMTPFEIEVIGLKLLAEKGLLTASTYPGTPGGPIDILIHEFHAPDLRTFGGDGGAGGIAE